MKINSIFLIFFLSILSNSVFAQKKYLSTGTTEPIIKEYKANKFSSDKTFADNIKEVEEFSVLSKIFEDETLKNRIEAKEGVTIFAMTDASFSKLSKKEKEVLLSNKSLMKDMVYHLSIPGRIDRNGLEVAVKKHGGSALLSTLEGETLKVTQKDGQLFVSDSNNNSARIVETNFFHKNGLFHIIQGMIWLDPKND